MEHSLKIDEVFKKFKTSNKGLSGAEVNFRLKEYGQNKLTEKHKTPMIVKFLEEFSDLMVIILIIAAIIAGIAGEVIDASVILFIVILNACIGFIQKFKAEKALEALQKMVSPHARVIRDGEEVMIDAENLVPGDIVILGEGDKITADIRLIECSELRISEATLTGESSPVVKSADIIHDKNEHVADIRNVAFMGTSVVRGTGKGIVISTGMNTEFGKIAKLTTGTVKDKSPLQKEIFKIGVFVGKITFVISTILLVVGYFYQGQTLLDSFLFSVSVAVAAVPEGLPATITIALAIGVQRMAKKNAIIKQLSSVETLGSTTVICSDKTGTLTKNEMTVQELYFDNYDVKITGVGYSPNGDMHFKADKNIVSLLNHKEHKITMEDIKKRYNELYQMSDIIFKAATLCNNAKLIIEKGKVDMLGDPTEGALLTMTAKAGYTKEGLAKSIKRIYELPFESDRKRMSVICKEKIGKTYKHIAYVKGAPEMVLPKCTHILKDGEVKKLTENDKKYYEKLNIEMAGRALRVIALAYKEVKENKTYKESDVEINLIFAGLSGIIDPPRTEVKEAVEMTYKAGIKIYIVTGDQGLTAGAIAKKLNIVGDDFHIITGQMLDKLSVTKLKQEFKKHEYIIFARVSPSHKLKVVDTLKKMGEVVAVTGDGVNDAPALKRADIGVAMGIVGTDVSKEAANMVLADDKFNTIINAIKEGRTIYGNLKKFIFYIFSCNIGELITVFAAIILALPAPLTAVLILAVDLGTDVLPALALGVEPSEDDTMNRPPRNPKERIMQGAFVTRYLYVGTFIGLIVVGLFIFQLYNYGWSWGETLSRDSLAYMKSSTTAFAVLVLIQMVNAYNARDEKKSVFKIGIFKNIWLLGAIGISILTLFVFVEVPFVQTFLRTTHLTLIEWMMIIGASFGILVIEETRKLFSRLSKT
ncbi:MAG: cation-translocating P-type ATPase [Candidatus Peregrinibacteria bacterium]|nr:cation-translocating P-type ATPase [Candidatus Peregrinibacteria bacterium]MDZ4245401.1 cation-translocating P-type ATPase [Candidatus Gracilibacteria bacterium]